MSKKSEEVDINEAFENLLFAEEAAQRVGYKEGFNDGKQRLFEGYHLGYHRASLLAAQLGYYSGVLEGITKPNSLYSVKIQEEAKKLQREIYSFPRTNDETADIAKCFTDIKLKYQKLCATAKISPNYPETDKLEF